MSQDIKKNNSVHLYPVAIFNIENRLYQQISFIASVFA